MTGFEKRGDGIAGRCGRSGRGKLRAARVCVALGKTGAASALPHLQKGHK